MTIILVLSSHLLATPIKFHRFFDVKMEPITELSTNTIEKIDITVTRLDRFFGDENQIGIIGVNGLQVLSRSSLVADFSKDSIFNVTIEVIIPDSAISKLRIEIYCGESYHGDSKYFVPSTNEVEFIRDPKSSKYYKNPYQRQKKPAREDFTEEELDKEIEINMLFPDSASILRFEEITNIKPIPNKKIGFITKISLRFLFDLIEENFEIGFTGEVPWPKSWPPRESKTDTPKPQGSIDDFKSQSYASGFSLESVEGQVMPGALPTNTPITFKIRLNK